jgi:hypothetical protein
MSTPIKVIGIVVSSIATVSAILGVILFSIRRSKKNKNPTEVTQ